MKILHHSNSSHHTKVLISLILCLSFLTFSNTVVSAAPDNVYVDTSLPEGHLLRGAVAKTEAGTFHLFSHGRPGELYIEGQWRNAQEIAGWLKNSNLNLSPSLYLYGCYFAQGEKGRAAVAYLEQALGIFIAASDDITGPDGDWELEAVAPTYLHITTPQINYPHNLQSCTNTTLYATADAFTAEEDPSDEFGTCDDLGMTYYSGGDYDSYIYSQFDLSGISSSCVVTSAQLILTHGGNDCWGEGGDSGPITMQARRVTGSWSENSINWNNQPGNTGSFGTDSGRRGDSDGTTYTFDVTSLVQQWLSGTPNHGVVVVPVGSPPDAYFSMQSREESGNDGPRLVITLGPGVDPCDPVASGNPDTDGDGISDECDLDDDNDGILDSVESPCAGAASSNLADFDNQSPADAVLANNVVEIGDSRMTLGLATQGNRSIVTNRIDDFHYTGDVGVRLGHSSGNTINDRIIATYDFSIPILDLEFRLHDVDAGDNLIVEAYDENNNLINISSSNYTLFSSTIVTYAGGNRFSATGQPDLGNPNNRSRVDINYAGQRVSRIIIRYYDLSGSGSYTASFWRGQSCSVAGDTDMDGIPNSLDLDSDADGCPDVVESGGVDNNNDGILDGTGINGDGQVTGGTGGYNGATGNEYEATRVTVNTTPTDQVVGVGDMASFSVSASADAATSYNSGTPIYGTPGNANGGINYQWYLGDPNASGTPLSNSGVYSGTNTPNLNISDVTGLIGNAYFVRVTHDNNVCVEEINSASLLSADADLAVTKTVDDGTPNVGNTVVFTITATNNGPENGTGVVVNDLLPTGLTFVSATPSTGTYNNGTGEWAIGSLANGNSETLTIQATATENALPSAINTASITGNQPDPVPGNNSDDATVTPVINPGISLIKNGTFQDENNDGFAQAGETIDYTFTVENTGDVTLTNVSVTDPLVPVTGGPLPSLAPGGSDNTTFTATYILTQADINLGSVSNQATATGTPPTGPNVTDLSDDNSPLEDMPTVIDLAENPAIAIVKTGSFQDDITPDGFAESGETIDYVFTVTNRGNVPLDNVTVDDPLFQAPNPLVSISGPSGDTGVDGVLGLTETWVYTATYTITTADITNGSVINQATATGDSPQNTSVSDLSDNNSVLEDDPTEINISSVPRTDLGVTKEVDNATPVFGNNVTFTITVTNYGPSNATNVVVNDLLPGGLTYQSDNAAGGYMPGSGVWTIGNLNVNQSVTLQIVAAADNIGSYLNTAIVSSDVPDYFALNDQSSAEVFPVFPHLVIDLPCNETVFDLTTIDVENQPAGTIITYHNGTPPSLINQLVDPTSVGEGVYYLAFYDPVDLCFSGANQVTINTSIQPSAGTSGTTVICEGESTPQDLFAIITGEDGGGTWTETSSVNSGVTIGTGSSIDFSGVAPGVYEFTYTQAAVGTCGPATSTANITVLERPEAGIGSSTEFCTGSGASTDLTALLSGADAGGAWMQTGGTTSLNLTNPASVDFSNALADTYTFTYTVSGNVACPGDVATVTVTVTACSTVAINDINQTPLNVPVSGDVSTNDFDPQGDNQTLTSALADTDGDGLVDDNLPLNSNTTIYGTDDDGNVVIAGTLTLNTAGTYTFTPAAGFTGDVPFEYTVTDDNPLGASTDDATVAIEVIGTSIPGANEPPVANDDTKTSEQDVNVGGNVLDNDSDPDGDPISVIGALADTDGNGTLDDILPLGSSTTIYGTDGNGNTVLAGVLTLNTDGTFIFDPVPSFLGEVPVDYTISDPEGLTDDATLTILIEADSGNVTYANDDANSGPQNITQTGNILDNDTDPEGDNQTVTSATDSDGNAITIGTQATLPSGGLLTISGDGNYTYLPAAGFVGTEIIEYMIIDNGSPIASDVATLYLTTLPVNNTVAINDINQTPENVPVNGDVSTNDFDPQGDNQVVTGALADTDGDGVVDDNLPLGSNTTIYGTDDDGNVVVAGTLTLNNDGTYAFIPTTGFTGDVPFEYTVTDDNTTPATDNATVAIEVIGTSIPGTNEPPVANDDTKTSEQDVNVGGNVLDNDSDPDGDPINVIGALADTDGDGTLDDILPLGSTTPVYGTDGNGNTVLAGVLTLNTNGTFTFDPEPNFLGEVPVDYTISDPAGLTDDATLTILIEADSGNVTYANDDANSGPQNVTQTGNILDNDTDPEGDNQTVTSATDSDGNAVTIGTQATLPSGGLLTISGDGSYTYLPATDFVGTEIVEYMIIDNGSPIASDVATLYLTTLAVNSTVAINDINQTPVNVPVNGDVSTNDFDPQGDNQVVTGALADTDGDGVVDDNLPLGSNTTIYGTDDDGNVVVAGMLTLNSDGTYTFTPATGFTGDVPFEYTVTDDNVNPATDNATVAIEVLGESVPGTNEPPVANDDTKTTEQDVNVGGNVLDNDSDPDGDPITVTGALADTDGSGTLDNPLSLGSATPVYGTDNNGNTVLAGELTLNTNGTFTFDPEPNFLGEVPVEYTISDPEGLMDDATLTILIEADTGNVTYANDDANVGIQDVTQTGNILDNDTDPEGDNQTVTSATDSDGNTVTIGTQATLPSGGLLTISGDGSYTYLPAAGFVGTEIVEYMIIDNGSPLASDVATLYLTTIPLGCITVETFVYLEGSVIAADGSESYSLPMRTDLNDLRLLPGQVYDNFFDPPFYNPAGQPFGQAPWDYFGTEGDSFDSGGDPLQADAGYPATVVDWVLVSLRSDAAGTGGPLCQAAALLHEDGRVELVEPFDCCDLNASGSYFLVIEHRNHLIVMSETPLPIQDGKITYDFRTQQSYIDDPFNFGTFVGQKRVDIDGVTTYLMFAGNGEQTNTVDADTDINFGDRTFWEIQNGTIGRFRIGDYNMNGDINFNDRRVFEINNSKFSSVPRN